MKGRAPCLSPRAGRRRAALLVFAIAHAVVAASAVAQPARQRADTAAGRGDAVPALTIQVLGGDVFASFYRYDDLLARLAGGAGPVLVRLTELDVERCLVEPSPSAVMLFELNESASARWRAAVTEGAYAHPFHVDLRGRRLFSGLTYFAFGAAAIEYPILDPIRRGGRVSLFVRSSLVDARTPEEREAQRRRIDDPALRQVFQDRGVLEERPRVEYPWPRRD